MTLLALKKYLQEQQRVSLQQLMTHFNRDAEMMRDLLSRYIEKGQVRLVKNPAQSCSACSVCTNRDTQYALEMYEWVEKDTKHS